MENAILEAVKKKLRLDEEVYTDFKDFLEQTIEDTENELKLLMEETTIPSDYYFIVQNVVVKRFNRMQNEGMESYSAGEKSITYAKRDFDEYEKTIQKYLNTNDRFSGVVDIW